MSSLYAYILLTRANTVPAALVRLWTGDTYSHAAISLDSPLHVYSFGRRSRFNFLNGGFIEENLRHSMHPDMRMMILRLAMTADTYRKAQLLLAHFQDFSDHYRYNFAGIIGLMLGRNTGRKNAYFCSQFVSVLLKDCGACTFAKPVSFIKPQDFLELEQTEILYEGPLSRYLSQAKKRGRLYPDPAMP